MKTKIVNIHEAKTHLSELLTCALQGEEVIIAKANKPLVKLTPLKSPRAKRVFGNRPELVLHLAEDFDAPLPDAFWRGEGRA
jgi:prevent-host-death family protein